MKHHEAPVIDIECVFGENMIEYLSNKYPGCELDYSVFHWSGTEYSPDMPKYLRDRMKTDPNSDFTNDGWDVAEVELWGYTHFAVSTLDM